MNMRRRKNKGKDVGREGKERSIGNEKRIGQRRK